jgi:ABC-type Fe3+ transport system substrate-binding protein
MGANRAKILVIHVSGTHVTVLASDRHRKNAWSWLDHLLSRSY